MMLLMFLKTSLFFFGATFTSIIMIIKTIISFNRL